ncbi:MAG: MgtC/SapB family protein [Burkholderiales bacterium]
MSYFDWLPREAIEITLVLSLAFLVGLEREEHKGGGKRVAFGGVRTFPLIGLTGYALALLAGGELLPQTLGFLAIAGFLMLTYRHKLGAGQSGITSEMAGLLTYLVGALVQHGDYWIATTLAVVSVVLLELKSALERLTARIEPDDILTFAKFLLLTAVALPLLPNAEYTAFRINPNRTWLIVVAVSGISYGSYVLQRLTQQHRGILLTALLGGTYSSTAVTVSLARQSTAIERPRLIAGATLLACGVMYLRLALLLYLFNHALFDLLALPFGLLAGTAAVTGWFWSRADRATPAGTPAAAPAAVPSTAPRNPLELGTALVFAAVFVAMLVATRYVAEQMGPTGIFGLAAVLGIADVDPFTMGLTQSAPVPTPLAVAAAGILIAAAANNAAKACYAFVLARNDAGRQTMALLLALSALGLLPLLALAGSAS